MLEVARERHAVCKNDAVLHTGVVFLKPLVGHHQRRVEAGAPDGHNRRNPVLNRLLISHSLQRDHLFGRLVEGDHPKIIVLVQHLDGGDRGLLGEIHFGKAHPPVCHAPGFVDDADDRSARPLLGLDDVHVDGEELLDWRAVVATRAKALVAANHDEALAQVAHVALDHLHLLGRDVERGDVAENNTIVALKLRQVARDSGRVDDVGIDLLRAKGRCEVLLLSGIALDIEHARPATHQREAERPVVLGERIVAWFQARLIGMKAWFLEVLDKDNNVFARREAHLLRPDVGMVAEEAQGCLLGCLRGGHHAQLKRLADLHLVWEHHPLQQRLGAPCLLDGHYIDRHALCRGERHLLKGVAKVLIPIREEHDAPGISVRERGEGQAQGARKVRIGGDRRARRLIQGERISQRGFDEGIRAKENNARLVSGTHLLGGGSYLVESMSAVLGPHAIGVIHKEPDGLSVAPVDEGGAGKGEDEKHGAGQAHAQGNPPAPGVQAGE